MIMNNGHDGDASHCCVGTGTNLVSCHNPGKKDVAPSTTWYSGGYINAVYHYSGSVKEGEEQQKEGEEEMEAEEKSIPPPQNFLNDTSILQDTVISCSPYGIFNSTYV